MISPTGQTPDLAFSKTIDPISQIKIIQRYGILDKQSSLFVQVNLFSAGQIRKSYVIRRNSVVTRGDLQKEETAIHLL